jgi:hypothetical protein
LSLLLPILQSWEASNNATSEISRHYGHRFQDTHLTTHTMSTDNAARFYWGKLDKGTAIFKAGNPEEAQDLCLQLSDDFRCPRPIHATLLVEPNKQARATL